MAIVGFSPNRNDFGLLPFPEFGRRVFSMKWLPLLTVLAASIARADFQTPLAIENARIVTGNGTVVEQGTVLIDQGRIVAVGAEVEIPLHAERFDANGMTAYPGFIDAMVHLGIPETPRTVEQRQRLEDFNPDQREDPLPAMHGANRRGVRPQSRAIEQFTPEAKVLEAHRAAGFTAAMIAPRDGILAGSGDLVNLSGAPIRRVVVAADLGMHASFDPGEPGDYPQTLLGVFAVFRQTMLDAERHVVMAEKIPGPAVTKREPADPALTALMPVLSKAKPVIFEANSEREIHRALDLAREFNFDIIISGGREAYKAIARLKSERVGVIVTLKFDEEPEYGKKNNKNRKPKEPSAESTSAEAEPKEAAASAPETEAANGKKQFEPLRVRRERRRLWEEQVRNLIVLQDAGIPVALRTREFNKLDDFFKNLRLLFDRGLTEEAAICALSKTPAEIHGAGNLLGGIVPGEIANITLMSKPISEKGAEVKAVLIDGKKYETDPEEKKGAEKSEKENKADEPASEPKAADEDDLGPEFECEIRADRLPRTRTGGNVLIRGATILPVSAPALTNASILIANGKIAAIGSDVECPPGTTIVDASGKYVLPGFVDPHSHLGIDAVNESPLAISAEVRIADVIHSENVGLYRALAGGTTTHHIMHGSANPIGGQCAVVKLKYARPTSELIVADAPRTIKFALGENVKQSNFPSAWDKRFPNTRMGVESTLRIAFNRARAYQAEWGEYRRQLQSDGDVAVPRTDLRLEALAGVLDGQVTIHCHCYRSEEILRLFDVAEEYGIRVGTLHHVLEGYRIAPEIARHGSGASSFANAWAYKVEAYAAIPHNAALMTEFGVHSSLNSDSPDTIRYLGQEAAKCVRWGGMDQTEALKLVTLNSAMQLGIDHRVGSLEVGKDGDVAIFNGHPLNSFSRCVMTLIEGEVYFEDSRAGQDVVDSAPRSFAKKSAKLDRTIPSTPLRAYAIVNGTIHPMRGDPAERIENGTVVIVEDKVQAVGAGVSVPPGAGIIDAQGLHVYPGLIDAGGTMGLSEIGFVRATEDHREIGSFNPDLRAITAVHPHSEHIKVARATGITISVARPAGGRLAGQSTVIHLDGWTAPEMTLVESFALHGSVPSLPPDLVARTLQHDDEESPSHCMSGVGHDEDARWRIGSQGAGTADEEEAKKKRKDEHKKNLRELNEYWDKAVHYAKVKELASTQESVDFETDLALEAMVPFVRGVKPVVLHASGYKEILDTMEFAEKRKLRWILAGGAESWKLADELVAKRIPVILSSPTTYPSSDFEPWDSVYRCAGVLDRAGVKFCFGTDSAADSYNLGIEVAMAVAHGLPHARAEYVLTGGAAEILGIADRYGSIEPGKQADLIVTTDSPLQAAAQVSHVFIDGRPVGLSNVHSQNYEKFRGRPRPKLTPAPQLRGPRPLTAHSPPRTPASPARGP